MKKVEGVQAFYDNAAGEEVQGCFKTWEDAYEYGEKQGLKMWHYELLQVYEDDIIEVA